MCYEEANGFPLICMELFAVYAEKFFLITG